MSLQQWQAKGWLIAHHTSSREVQDLLGVADRDLRDCQLEGLSADWKLAIAYNAAHQSSMAALYAAGYEVARGQSHHMRTTASLEHTIGMGTGDVDQFEKFRKKRNVSGYDRAGTISDQEARQMVELAKKIRADVEAWLRQHHSSLL